MTKVTIGDWEVELELDDYGGLVPTIKHASRELVFTTSYAEIKVVAWSEYFTTDKIEEGIRNENRRNSRNRRAAELAGDHHG